MASIWTTRANLGMACARGLASCAFREAQEASLRITGHDASSVSVSGTLLDAMRLNLMMRTPHRILYPLFEAEAKNLDHLYRHALEAPWEEWLEPDGYFSVHGIVKNDTVHDTRMPSLRLKDAIADRMRRTCGRRPDSGHEDIGAAVFFIWKERSLRVFIDTTGEPLSRRGYRLIPGNAPMQETLAAACVLSTGWNEATPFISPMCGSGTPAIEAAMIAKRRAPGALRTHFAFMSLKGFKEEAETAWLTMKAEAAKNETPASKMPRIVATDISHDAVRIARANAKSARMEQFISFGVCDFADTVVAPPPGTIFMNPEYGERLGEREALKPLYRRIGAWLADHPRHHSAILTASPMLTKETGLKPIELLPFFNGPIECRLVKFA